MILLTLRSIKKYVELTSSNKNYVNKLSIWAAYFIFCLACFFSSLLINLGRIIFITRMGSKYF
ncbi:hypothetical protein C6353_26680 [Bacillus toyonensis]|nr:hypothetical protein C6353_26680 [Bacillus toyonensis]